MTKFESDSIRLRAVFRGVHWDIGRFTLCAWVTVCRQCTGQDLIAMLRLPPSFAGGSRNACLGSACSVKSRWERREGRRAFSYEGSDSPPLGPAGHGRRACMRSELEARLPVPWRDSKRCMQVVLCNVQQSADARTGLVRRPGVAAQTRSSRETPRHSQVRLQGGCNGASCNPIARSIGPRGHALQRLGRHRSPPPTRSQRTLRRHRPTREVLVTTVLASALPARETGWLRLRYPVLYSIMDQHILLSTFSMLSRASHGSLHSRSVGPGRLQHLSRMPHFRRQAYATLFHPAPIRPPCSGQYYRLKFRYIRGRVAGHPSHLLFQ